MAWRWKTEVMSSAKLKMECYTTHIWGWGKIFLCCTLLLPPLILLCFSVFLLLYSRFGWMFDSPRRSRGMAIRPTNKGIKYKDRQRNRAKSQWREQHEWSYVIFIALVPFQPMSYWRATTHNTLHLMPLHKKPIMYGLEMENRGNVLGQIKNGMLHHSYLRVG